MPTKLYLHCIFCHEPSTIEAIPIIQDWICPKCVKERKIDARRYGHGGLTRYSLQKDGSIYGEYDD